MCITGLAGEPADETEKGFRLASPTKRRVPPNPVHTYPGDREGRFVGLRFFLKVNIWWNMKTHITTVTNPFLYFICQTPINIIRRI